MPIICLSTSSLPFSNFQIAATSCSCHDFRKETPCSCGSINVPTQKKRCHRGSSEHLRPTSKKSPLYTPHRAKQQQPTHQTHWSKCNTGSSWKSMHNQVQICLNHT